MLSRLARTLFGSSNDRVLRNFKRRAVAINALEPQIAALDDAALAAKTQEFRQRLADGEKLDALLEEAFAVAREAAKRVLGMRHFDVQLIGGMVLHDGRIAEMKTGEGKTLVATLAVYLNALAGKGVHVVTVNDYLARRDAEQMSLLYGFLGLSTGIVVPGVEEPERRAAYAADITYGTNNEFGFDYLRDNMKYRLEDMVQRPFNFAIVDEVDSILVDEARTPLIISGPSDEPTELYAQVDEVVAAFLAKGARSADNKHEFYDKDEKARTVHMTERGAETVEAMLQEIGLLVGGLYDRTNVPLVHHVQQSLRARTLYTRDVDYIVRDGKIVIIDEFTGRMLDGRRYSDGLHQALEAKEKVEVLQENQTLASITFQNYFRLYPKLSGMTGTASTEADEFDQIYKLGVVEIPTNLPVARHDQDDEVYRTADEKYDAVIKLILECNQRGQPVLVGTTSIEKSEHIAGILTQNKIPHSVLNARFHEQEAKIIAQAGALGSITIATNMAGRGTDIKLGGNYEMRLALEPGVDPEALREEIKLNQEAVKAAGGLFIIGTERHESRRIDNQLRGRAGRQGDPGGSRFFLSLEDDLLRIFGSERMAGMLQKLGLKQGEAITHPFMNRALEKAQRKVEIRNFDMRKNVLKYDDVMNDQRKEIYAQRKEFMHADSVTDVVTEMREDVIAGLVANRVPEKAFAEQWQTAELAEDMKRILALDLPIIDWAAEEGIDEEHLRERIAQAAQAAAHAKAEQFGPQLSVYIEKSIILQTLDHVWKEHLLGLDYMRQGIGLRGYGQRDPLNEYKREAFGMFSSMLDDLKERVTVALSHVTVQIEPPTPPVVEEIHPEPGVPALTDPVMEGFVSHEVNPAQPETWGATPRNAPCPCGSGIKYKYCHGKLSEQI